MSDANVSEHACSHKSKKENNVNKILKRLMKFEKNAQGFMNIHDTTTQFMLRKTPCKEWK
jgi:hypothetical protein